MRKTEHCLSQKLMELNSIVDDIFKTLEDVKQMFAKWDSSHHKPFIEKVMYLNTLREKLYQLGYTDDFVDTLVKTVYHNVFIKQE